MRVTGDGGLVKPSQTQHACGSVRYHTRLRIAHEYAEPRYSIGYGPYQTRNAKDTTEAVGNAMSGILKNPVDT